jgi:hypothetical protein
MRYLHSGGANAPAGLYLIDVDGAYLANGTREDDTTELAEVEVNVTEHAAGRPVYLFANQLVTGSWANLFVDNIRFVDSGGNELQCPGPPSLPPYPPRDPPSSPASAAGIAGDPKLRGGHGTATHKRRGTPASRAHWCSSRKSTLAPPPRRRGGLPWGEPRRVQRSLGEKPVSRAAHRARLVSHLAL